MVMYCCLQSRVKTVGLPIKQSLEAREAQLVV